MTVLYITIAYLIGFIVGLFTMGAHVIRNQKNVNRSDQNYYSSVLCKEVKLNIN